MVLGNVAQAGRQLAYAAEELRNDKEVVLTAVAQDGQALFYASDELRNSKEVVLAAAVQDTRALLYASKALNGLTGGNEDQTRGIDIVRRALRAPARQIAENAGEDGAYIVGKLLEGDDYNHGFNAATGEYEDLVKSGVIDPAKVVRTALQDAASVASLLITTEALVAELPKEDAPAPMPAMDY